MKYIKRTDKFLLILSIVLFIIGLVMVFSSSNVTAYMRFKASPYYYFIHQAVFLGVGLILFLIMINLSSRTVGKISHVLMYAMIIVLGVLLVFGKSKNDAVSWIKLGKISLQPSEFAKVITIFYLAYYYDKNKNNLNNMWTLLKPLVPCFIILLLIMLQPDLGTSIIYAVIVGTIFFAQPMPKLTKFKLVTLLLCLLLVVGLVEISGNGKILGKRQTERFNIKNPCDRLLTDGNQVCNGYIAMNNGGLWGKGLGNSTQKYLYLPEPYTDFIFCILVEELGAVFGLVVLLLYVLLIYRILRIGNNVGTNIAKSICYGVFVYLVLHISVNLLGIMGLIPLTGVPLPFISYGGSFTVCLIAALTEVQRVYAEKKLKSEKE